MSIKKIKIIQILLLSLSLISCSFNPHQWEIVTVEECTKPDKCQLRWEGQDYYYTPCGDIKVCTTKQIFKRRER